MLQLIYNFNYLYIIHVCIYIIVFCIYLCTQFFLCEKVELYRIILLQFLKISIANILMIVKIIIPFFKILNNKFISLKIILYKNFIYFMNIYKKKLIKILI